jgi:hypothetical protein
MEMTLVCPQCCLYELPVHDIHGRPFAMCPNCGTFVRVRPQWRPARCAAGVATVLMVGALALLAASGCKDGGPIGDPETARTGPGYVGAFRVPDGKIGDSSFAWGGTALAFNPANNSLFLVGHDHQQAVAEVQIPASVANSRNLKDLPTAKVLQPLVKVTARIPKYTLEGDVKIGGLMVVDGRLVGTLYEYYDADADAVQSHFVLDSLSLATANVGGLYTVGTLGGGFVGGYMAAVPAELRDELGSPYVTGQAALCIIGRTSSGPALFGFDPTDLGPTAAPVKPYVFYPLKNPLGKIDARNPYFNGNTEIRAVVFAPGMRSVLFFGAHGIGDVGYGEPEPFNDPHRRSKGWHSVNGQYAYQVWAYDVDDFVAVKYGIKKPWEIKPSQVKTFDFPVDHPAKHLGGAALDAATGRLYVSQLWTGGGDALPLIHVFQMGTDASLSWLPANPLPALCVTRNSHNLSARAQPGRRRR